MNTVVFIGILFIFSIGMIFFGMLFTQHRPILDEFHIEPLVLMDLHLDIDFDFDEIDAAIDALDQDRAARTDTQNVHDSGVQSHIRSAIINLKQHQPPTAISVSESVKQIKHAIMNESKLSDQIRERALTAISRIVQQNGIIVSIQLNELEILRLVWNRIIHPDNKEVQHMLADNLILQLADIMTDDTHACCIQGRITRIIQSLECADAKGIVNLVPLWAIKEEIANFFSNYQQKFISQLHPTFQRIFNETVDPTVQEEKLVKRINAKLASGIQKRLQSRYIDSGLLTEKQFGEITQPYFQVLMG